MRNHTTDPAVRASDIATGEERKRWGTEWEPFTDWPVFWLRTYHEALRQLSWLPDVETGEE